MDRVIALLREHDLLRVIDEELDIDLEIPHLAYIEVKKEDSRALLFTKPVSKRLQKAGFYTYRLNYCSYIHNHKRKQG